MENLGINTTIEVENGNNLTLIDARDGSLLKETAVPPGDGLIKKRDFSLDLLRFLGVLVIMVAHAEPPSWLYQLRNFGTPLLVVASALTYEFIYRHKRMEIKSFYKRRLSRLIFPAWMFLAVFFAFFTLTSQIAGQPNPFSPKIMADSYYFSGILYIWILKVYIVLALITPFALKIESKVKSSIIYYTVLFFLYAAYEILFAIFSPYIPVNYRPVLCSNVLLFIPYTLLFLYGLKLGKLRRRTIFSISFIALGIFLIMAAIKYSEEGEFVQTQEYRYPPTLYFLSYAFFCLNLLYLVKGHMAKLVHKKLITWLSANSLWIYLWHVLAAYSWDFNLGSTNGFFFASIVKAVALLSFGMTMTYVQVRIAKRYMFDSPKPVVRWLGSMLSPA